MLQLVVQISEPIFYLNKYGLFLHRKLGFGCSMDTFIVVIYNIIYVTVLTYYTTFTVMQLVIYKDNIFQQHSLQYMSQD